MKNLDFYKELLSHSLCYKYNEQIKIAKEYCDVIKEHTIKKSIIVTDACPKYISEIIKRHGGLDVITDNNNSDALFYGFYHIIKHIKSDKKYNYEIIVKNFCCGNYSDISKYIQEINKKLVDSHNTDINTIIGLLVDIPNYYLESINLYNKYNYNFNTQLATLTYHDLFVSVYNRLKNPSTFYYAIKELTSLIVLYYDLTHTTFDQYDSAFLNPLIEPIRSSMMNNIRAQQQINLTHTIDTLNTLDAGVNESEEEFVDNETKNTHVSEVFNLYDQIFNIHGNIDIYSMGLSSIDIACDIYYISNRNQGGKKLSFVIDYEYIMGIMHDHNLEFLTVMFLTYPSTNAINTHVRYIVKYGEKLYLLYKDTESEFDLCGIEIKGKDQKHSNRDVIGIDLDSDNKYEFILDLDSDNTDKFIL